ncbi:MAG: hypothetical protein KKB50_19575 [Planctomycetes bacterium]|nr:hypothetical protein [Planctomycetota bacterium]
MDSQSALTVGELKKRLAAFPDDYQITFSGVLEFARLKKRGDKLVDVEFNQTVYKTKDGDWRVDAH